MLEPWHSENHGVNAERGDVEGLSLEDAGDLELESDFARRMREETTVGEDNLNWGTCSVGRFRADTTASWMKLSVAPESMRAWREE
jgi:hypothetical protein